MLTRQCEFSWHSRMRRDAATTHLPHGKESVCFKLPRVLQQIIRPLKSVELGVCEVLIIINPAPACCWPVETGACCTDKYIVTRWHHAS